jgi:hypothetical protein
MKDINKVIMTNKLHNILSRPATSVCNITLGDWERSDCRYIFDGWQLTASLLVDKVTLRIKSGSHPIIDILIPLEYDRSDETIKCINRVFPALETCRCQILCISHPKQNVRDTLYFVLTYLSTTDNIINSKIGQEWKNVFISSGQMFCE